MDSHAVLISIVSGLKKEKELLEHDCALHKGLAEDMCTVVDNLKKELEGKDVVIEVLKVEKEKLKEEIFKLEDERRHNGCAADFADNIRILVEQENKKLKEEILQLRNQLEK